MPSQYPGAGLFPITVPDDADSPDGPAQFREVADDLQPYFRRAGAQAKKSIVPAEQARTNTAYGELGTPDRVEDLVVSTVDSLIFIAYQALWKSSVDEAAKAAIFLNADQVKIAHYASGAAVVQEAALSYLGAAGQYRSLSSFHGGLWTPLAAGGTDQSDVTTGQIVGASYVPADDTFGGTGGASTLATRGGIFAVFVAAAGVYDISVRFKASSGSVTAKNRKLWAWSKEFV